MHMLMYAHSLHNIDVYKVFACLEFADLRCPCLSVHSENTCITLRRRHSIQKLHGARKLFRIVRSFVSITLRNCSGAFKLIIVNPEP